MASAEHRSSSNTHTPPRTAIVDRHLVVVGWTDDPPEMTGALVRHRYAEALLQGPVSGVFIELDDAEDARTAGAPAGWDGPWRCLAIGPVGVVSVPMYREGERLRTLLRSRG